MAAGWESLLERQHSGGCSSLCAPHHQHTHPLRQQQQSCVIKLQAVEKSSVHACNQQSDH